MPHLATDECSQSPESVFHIPDSVFPFARNRCSRSSGIRTYLKNEELIQCWRKQWVEYDKSGFSGDRAILEIPDELEKNRRRCQFFFPYESGVPPAAHAERQNARHMTWFGVAGGGLMVLAVEFVKALFRWGQ